MVVSKKFPLRWLFDEVKKLAGCLSLQANDSEAAGAIQPFERGDGHTADDRRLIEAKRSKR
jgi:hypothetical protein